MKPECAQEHLEEPAEAVYRVEWIVVVRQLLDCTQKSISAVNGGFQSITHSGFFYHLGADSDLNNTIKQKRKSLVRHFSL